MDSIQADKVRSETFEIWLECWNENGRLILKLKVVDEDHEFLINREVDTGDWKDLQQMLARIDNRFLKSPTSSCKLFLIPYLNLISYYRHQEEREPCCNYYEPYVISEEFKAEELLNFENPHTWLATRGIQSPAGAAAT